MRIWRKNFTSNRILIEKKLLFGIDLNLGNDTFSQMAKDPCPWKKKVAETLILKWSFTQRLEEAKTLKKIKFY